MLAARYEKVISQGKRNDILREIEEIGTCGHDVHKSKSRDGIGEEYGMTGRNIARYMRVDKLIRPFKDRLDAGEMTLTAAVELSYLSEEEQGIAAAEVSQINESTAKAIRAAAGELTAEKLKEILHPAKKPLPVRSVSIKVPAEAAKKYFSGMKSRERTDLVMKALDAWFAERMTDLEKKQFMRTFIESIELYPEKKDNGRIISTIELRFPVYYDGQEGNEIRMPDKNTVEVAVLLCRTDT